MGWCSATTIFDNVAKFILSTDKPDQEKVEVLTALVDVLEDNDYDCQQDSAYWDHPIVQRVYREMHPDWEWDEK